MKMLNSQTEQWHFSKFSVTCAMQQPKLVRPYVGQTRLLALQHKAVTFLCETILPFSFNKTHNMLYYCKKKNPHTFMQTLVWSKLNNRFIMIIVNLFWREFEVNCAFKICLTVNTGAGELLMVTMWQEAQVKPAQHSRSICSWLLKTQYYSMILTWHQNVDSSRHKKKTSEERLWL